MDEVKVERKGRVEVFRGKSFFGAPQWYFRVKSSNGKVVLQSEGYMRKSKALQTARRLVEIIRTAEVVEI